MKKVVLLVALLLSSLTFQSQILTPQPSPKCVLNQMVGLTDVEVEYSRPGLKGRNIFGDLVPFGKVWRTGANSNTTISFSEDVVIDGKTLKKGKYALFTMPKVESWEVIFYSKTDNWGIPEVWNESDVAVRASVIPQMLNKNVENFTIDINNLDNNFGYLNVSWEKTLVSLKFEVPTQKMAMASIDKIMATPYWYTKLKSLIQAKLGDKKGAIETAKISLAAAKDAKNNDYVKMNEDNITEWSKK